MSLLLQACWYRKLWGGVLGHRCTGWGGLASSWALVTLDGREQQVWDFCALGSPSFVLASGLALSEAPEQKGG